MEWTNQFWMFPLNPTKTDRLLLLHDWRPSESACWRWRSSVIKHGRECPWDSNSMKLIKVVMHHLTEVLLPQGWWMRQPRFPYHTNDFFAKTQPYLAACICMRTRRWRRCGGASRASSCPCTSRWCSLNRWAGSCRGWWPRRTDQSMSVEWDKSKLIATHVRKGHTCGCTGQYIVNTLGQGKH